jgi:hypothetical protein
MIATREAGFGWTANTLHRNNTTTFRGHADLPAVCSVRRDWPECDIGLRRTRSNCARATTGHAAVPARPAMNCRRRIRESPVLIGGSLPCWRLDGNGLRRQKVGAAPQRCQRMMVIAHICASARENKCGHAKIRGGSNRPRRERSILD